ncbi:MAG: YitT family protein [Clostridia bacterium]|nr:YitT family protein [Clostridia bacterium]
MSNKISKESVLHFLIDTLFFAVGSVCYAAGINVFAVPNNIAQSGVTGLAIVANHFWHIPVGAANFIINIPLFILAWFVLGRLFVARTVWVVVILSAALDVTTLFLPAYTGDPLLASIFCGTLTGVGLGLVMTRGATSGGTDIAGKIVQKFFPQVSLGTGVAVANAIVVVIGAITFRSVESAMYAVVVIVLSGRVLDYIVYGLGKGKMLMIITEKPQQLADAIMQHVGRGVSILPVTGAYTGEKKSMLVVAIRRTDVAKIYKVLKTVDETAFTIITEAGEVLGEGFRRRDDL